MIKKYVFLTVGLWATGLGVVGVFVPLLPSVPFALVAFYCFSVSSPHFQRWLLNNRFLGPTLRNFKENRGLTIPEKLRILLVVWVSILGTVFYFLDDRFSTQAILISIAILETVVITLYKTRVETKEECSMVGRPPE